jgi:hypothetical protein
MIDLLAQVTPLTKGIIWITNGDITTQQKYYKDIDYLLNGLLTATLNSSATKTHVLVSENFGNSFYVFAGNVQKQELTSFLELVKPHLKDENTLVLIDENDAFKDLKKGIPEVIQSKIQSI